MHKKNFILQAVYLASWVKLKSSNEGSDPQTIDKTITQLNVTQFIYPLVHFGKIVVTSIGLPPSEDSSYVAEMYIRVY